ncbi:helix-turn-helix domain-containing protein [Amycolatopsis orientalis]|uniref:helix-turn-helix domain-containing protein n=1 Tax=Amycolatopsis orientalis TaxID=31958 RepID=UPI0014289290|nr:helix-turn-helix domain-containing protein [Amycolatopsis orientalis]
MDALVRHQGEAGLTQLANSCSLPKATTHRLLEQLTELEVVRRRENRYSIGAQAFRLGQAWQPYPRLLELARNHLQWLTRATRASAVLAVACDSRILIAAASLAESRHETLLRPGSTVPQRTGRFSAAWQAEHGLVVTEAPIRVPTGETIASIAVATAGSAKPGSMAETVGRAAHTLSAALRAPS